MGWNKSNNYCCKDDVVIWLQLNNKIAKIGDEEVELLAAPKAVDGRTSSFKIHFRSFGVSQCGMMQLKQ